MERRSRVARAAFALLMAMLALVLVPGGGGAALAQLPQPGRNAMSVELVAQSAPVSPGGGTTLALVMKPDPGWHGYWKNPGDAGAEPRIRWTLPPGVTIGELRYPVPDRLMLAGLMNYVYERDYALLADLRIAANVAPGTRLPIAGRLDYLVCTDQVCVPETAEVRADLMVSRVGQPSGASSGFYAYREALPRPLGRPARFEVENGRLRIGIPVHAALAIDDPYFYPLGEKTLRHSAPQSFGRAGDLLVIEAAAAQGVDALPTIDGVVELADGQGLQLTAERGDVPQVPLTLAGAGDVSGDRDGILIALVAAIVGGLLLNIMPCVFPILSLKAINLAKAGGDEKAARRDALAYAAGAILVCLLLGGLILLLREGGASVGWAFQLQDPRVILFLLLLITAIALNLAGLFELPTLWKGAGRSSGAAGSFSTGALAAFVATPCTGPFMGVALGAALILPAAAALAVFAGLGLGLSLPFLLLGFVPALRRKLPKPGPWMAKLRRVLSIPMFLTAVGLAWILGRQSGVDGMALGIFAAFVLAFGLWWTGVRQGRARAWLPLLPALLVGLAAITVIPSIAAPAARAAPAELGAVPFSEAKLADLRASGRPVFLYFTADWCLTCKVNEKTALDRDDVAQSFAERNVQVMVGDWTRGDAEIGRFLERHGRSGIPLYIYYPPAGEPRILPQILTPGRLKSLG